MKWSSLLVLAGLLALWARLQPASGQLVPVRKCPPSTKICVRSFPPECGLQRPCALGKTCCYFNCKFQCLDLKGKPGMCLLNPMWCSKPQPNECSSDFQCRGRLKCCYWRCAWRCEEPVQVISRPSLRKRHREEQV
ncbi:hypothetical protein Y1Q_0000804 [Alligator mississippiensis]|uniref:WAP domain-containing protein n=1 Tax=Alligator mississippiensis TaxID=8496 RepID=A0A151NQF0_ALLMI|nr:hypothetical protein Y1Q_0000804 [Alligator mississippiensis]